jgi:hypothetical protein
MSGILAGFLGACVAAVAGLLIAGIVTFVKRRVKVTGPVIEAVEELAEEMRRVGAVANMSLCLNKPILDALRAILEGLKGDVNGNVDRALESVSEAQESYSQFLLDSATGASCKEAGS